MRRHPDSNRGIEILQTSPLNHLGMAPNRLGFIPDVPRVKRFRKDSLLSLVVISQDEEDRIGPCLASVPWAKERIVLDSGSTDRTVEVAQSAGAQVIETDWPGYVDQKNRALSYATQPWILSLDADERLDDRAARELSKVLNSPGGAKGFSFQRRSLWMGRVLRFGTWARDRKIRVARRSFAHWEGEDPHDKLVVAGEVRTLPGYIIHEPYRTLREHFDTIDRYSRLSAEGLARRGVRPSWWSVLIRPPFHFFQAYVLRGGLLDGWRGLVVASLGSLHVFLKWRRLWDEVRTSCV